MIIKKFNQLNPDILSKQFPFFTLIVGEKSSDMFDYFGVEEMHGLKKSECYDKPGDCYIAGFCNVYPDNHSKHYLFLNSFRFNKTYLDYLLIMLQIPKTCLLRTRMVQWNFIMITLRSLKPSALVQLFMVD